MTSALLAAYASEALGREVAPDSFEVAEFNESLLRTTFKLGGRTAAGYYLDVVLDGLPGTSLKAQLKSPNDLMRMDLEREYRGYRNDWFRIFEHHIPFKLRPPKPLQHARVMFQVLTSKGEKHLLDAEAKYSALNPLLQSLYNPAMKHTAVKPLLDTLQGSEVFRGSGRDVTRRGLGILLDDTDGEHFRGGVIRQLEVIQRRLAPKDKLPRVRLVIEEVLPWTL